MHLSSILLKRFEFIIYPSISGLVLAISFNYPQFWFLGLFAFLPLFNILLEEERTLKEVFWIGWIFGSVFLGLAYVPIWHLLPLNWLGVESTALSIAFVFVYWGSFIFTLAVFSGGLWAMAVHTLKRKTFFDVTLLALLWVFFEYIRMWWFAVLTLGGGSFLSPYFSTGFVGYLLAANNPLLQFASIGGIYLLSFLVVFVNGLLYWILFRSKLNRETKRNVLMIGLIVFVLAVSLPVSEWLDRARKGDFRLIEVALIQTQFPARIKLSLEEEESRVFVLRELTERVAKGGREPEIIVYPEDSRFINTLNNRNELEALFDSLFENTEMLVIDSGRVKDSDQGVRSRMFYWDAQDHSLQTTDKRFFVPVGEYLPYIYRFFLAALGQHEIIEKLKRNRSYVSGTKTPIGIYNDVHVGGLFCSESLSPSFSGQLSQRGANILVNVSASAWFHESKILHNQQINVAKVRAVENNRYLVRSANFSPAFAVDNYGRIIGEMPWGETGVLSVSVRLITESSIYNKILDF